MWREPWTLTSRRFRRFRPHRPLWPEASSLPLDEFLSHRWMILRLNNDPELDYSESINTWEIIQSELILQFDSIQFNSIQFNPIQL